MGVGLFFSASFLLSNVIICTSGTTPALRKARLLVQKFLDRAIVAQDLTTRFSKLKTVSPKIITETDRLGRGKLVKFESSNQLYLKEAFHFMHFYPLIYGQEQLPTEFEIPVGKQTAKLKLTNKPDGSFSLKAIRKEGNVEVDLSNLRETVKVLSDSELKDPLKKTIREFFLKALDARLISPPGFKTELQSRDPKRTVTAQEMETAFRAATDLLVATAIKKVTLGGLNPPDWVQEAHSDIGSKMKEVRDKQSREIAAAGETELRFEFTQSMLKTKEEAIEEWNKLRTLDAADPGKKVIEEKVMGMDKKPYKTVTIHETDQISLKEIFKLLQFYREIFQEQGGKQTRFEVQIGGETRKFRLRKAPRGKNQIWVETYDNDWPGTTKRGNKGKGGGWGPDYNTMIDEVLAKFPQHGKLAKTMLKAVDSTLNNQPHFEAELKIPDKPTESADTVRASVEFMVISMVAEAAQPTDQFKDTFFTKLAKTIEEQKVFPERGKIPNLAYLHGKSGRIPAMDVLVEDMLKTVGSNRIEKVFSKEGFPVRERGGTNEGRKIIHGQGSEIVDAFFIQERAAKEHDKRLLVEKVSKECPSRRKKRFICSLKDRNSAAVDENSIKITEDRVEFDLVDRRDAKQREHVKLQITREELATAKLIKDNLSHSRRAGMSETYAKVNKGLAVHGLIFSFLAAGRYFEEGENFRGAMTIAQSAHTLGGLTGLNEIASKVGQRVLSSAAKGLAKSLNLEKGLERLSTNVERYAERGVGQLLGAVPGVGLAFDIYFIEQDIEELADLDFNDPEDLKLLPLRVIDLALDVSTTVLNLVGTFCPLAEVITEPLVIVLSIIRMAIDDFYIDIMAEIEKINWKSHGLG